MISSVSGTTPLQYDPISQQEGMPAEQPVDLPDEQLSIEQLQYAQQHTLQVADEDEQWLQITSQMELQHTQFEFDPQQAPYEFEVDAQGELAADEADQLFLPASLLADKVAIVEAVHELFIDAMDGSRRSTKEIDRTALSPWKQEVADFALEANRDAMLQLDAKMDSSMGAGRDFVQRTEMEHVAQLPQQQFGMLDPRMSHELAARFATFLAEAGQKGFSMNVHGLLTHVMRVAYMEGTKDLIFRRDKVRACNEGKKLLRAHIHEQRQLLTKSRLEGVKALQAELDRRHAAKEAYRAEKEAAWQQLFDAAKARYDNYQGQDAYQHSGRGSSGYHAYLPGPPHYGVQQKNDYMRPLMSAYNDAHPQMSAYEREDFADAVSNEFINFTGQTVCLDTEPPQMVHTTTHITTREELETYIQNKDGELATLGDDAQMANIDLQNTLQRQQQLIQTMTNISKLLHDTAMAVIRKIGS